MSRFICSTKQSTFAVTGTNSGLGLAFVTSLVSRPEAIVFAGVRNLKSAEDSGLAELVKEHADKLHVVQITSADEADNRAAAKEVERIAGKVDVIIANAG